MTQIAGKITEYFGREAIEAAEVKPYIAEIFLAGKGWVPTPQHAPATFNAVTTYAIIAGVEAVLVTFDGRSADFEVEEIKAFAARPLLGGRVI